MYCAHKWPQREKALLFSPRRGIMAEAEYPGIAKLVARVVWECVDPIHARLGQKSAKPCGTGDSGFFPGCWKRHKSGFDHINDHRQKKLYFYRSPWYHGRNWISGCGSTGRARHLGCRGWVFKSPHSDQNPSEIVDFRGIFLILWLLRRRIWGIYITISSKRHLFSKNGEGDIAKITKSRYNR